MVVLHRVSVSPALRLAILDRSLCCFPGNLTRQFFLVVMVKKKKNIIKTLLIYCSFKIFTITVCFFVMIERKKYMKSMAL